MLKKRVSLCFFYFFLCLNCGKVCYAAEASGLEDRFTNAFRGTSAFYAITVARDTITDTYGALTPEEKEIVFLMLIGLLSGENRRFIEVSRRFIEEKEKWFTERKAALERTARESDSAQIADLIIDEAADTFAKVPAFRGFLGFGIDKGKKEECKGALKAFLLDSIGHRRAETVDAFRERLRGFFRVQDKASTPVFETKSKEIFDAIATHDERLAKTRHDEAERLILRDASERTAFERYDSKIGRREPREFFESVLANVVHIGNLSQRIHREKIQDHPCLIVFNEMFFSKDTPLSFDEFGEIEGTLRGLTHRHAKCVTACKFSL